MIGASMAMGDEVFAIRGDLVLGGTLTPGAVVIDSGRIAAVHRAPRDGALPPTMIAAAIVAPGLIDLQVNGGFGVEVGADSGALATLARRLPETGVTTFLPTVISASLDAYRAAFAAYTAAHDTSGARMPGLHLEGPYLAPARKGAHPLAAIEQADPRLLDECFAAGCLRLMTLAPERPGAAAVIRRLRERGVAVSLGHTDATLAEFVAGVDAGATMATHLFNAMSPFAHRAPGAIGAALVDDRVTVGLIADGIHSHPASIRLAVRAKGPARVALVTDMMAAAGMPPGTYGLGGQRVTVDQGGARLADGTLAGAVLTLDAAIRNVVRWADITPAMAITMATEVPARVLGLAEAGRLLPDAPADLTLFNDDLRVIATIIGGRIAYQRME